MALQMLSCLRISASVTCSSTIVRSCAAGAKTSAAASKTTPLPERPKRPMTGYVNFVKDTMPTLYAPDGSKLIGKDAITKASELWKKLPMTERERYNRRYIADKEKYQAALAAFEARLTPQVRGQLVQAERQRRQHRSEQLHRRQKRRELADMNKPRRPPIAFMLWVMNETQKNPGRDGLTLMDYSKEMARRWKQLSDQDKSPYQLKYTKLKEQYEEDLLKWEKKMVAQGRADLVREKSQPIILASPPAKKQPSKR